ncbi:ABC transporter ATP-binding protein [Rubellicoccus peritrichatus]|uniref:ABC transporter ATP-binding protein n=1 Tax=Rubellicoccus peritrichatus TaxID=3080537 RepID=A0AAQ3QQW6_9BACT|nr:ABC transporter ATP-binding protein [Puniceicoccus sp. CR14]WOO40673.1 ABC transporter ATP-binding protein [Puniceicoccus sp. CR14]
MSNETDNDPAIKVDNLSKRYGKLRAIDGVSFSVERGQVVGFLGPNGAGKSTTMRILCGLMPATSGRAYICGIPVASQAHEAKRKIGYMPEHNPLPADMRVIEYLRYRARLREIHGKAQKKAVDEAMEVCDLHRKARRRLIGTLSKGFRQRVGIADAILAKPDVIIMDEPTIGLDPHQILAIRRLIESLRGQMTVVISSHILPEIERVCDRIIIINQGRVVASGTPDSLREDFLPTTCYRLQVAGDFEEVKSKLSAITPHATIEEKPGDTGDDFREIEIIADSDLQISESLLHALADSSSLRVREVAKLKPNLEDIFMAATKRSYDETASPFQRNGTKNASSPKVNA